VPQTLDIADTHLISLHDRTEKNTEEPIFLGRFLGENVAVDCVLAKSAVGGKFDDGNVTVAAVIHEVDKVDTNALEGLSYVSATY
jgi:hypothetical protein